MGQSTDALFFYGYCWDEEIDMDDFAPKEVRNLYGKEHPVLIGGHCSTSYPMPYVYIQDSHITAWRGSPQEVTSLAVDPDWQKMLDTFCAQWKINVEDMEPGWFVASVWET